MYPDAIIDYCTKQAYISLLEHNPYINQLIPLEKSVKELAKKLQKQHYTHVIDLHNNLRTFILKSHLKHAKIGSFDKINIKKLLAVKLKKINLLPNIHIVDRYFTATKMLGVVNDYKGLDYFFPHHFTQDPLPFPYDKDYIALVIGAQFQTKQFPIDKLIEICKNLPQQKFVIIGGKEDKERGDELVQVTSNVLNTAGQFSFNGSAYLIKNAKLILANDTGMMHIASAFQKKIISLWGNTIPEFGMYPYLPQNSTDFSIHEVKGLSCRPCSKIGFHSCPKKHFKCMNEQNVEAIIGDIQKMIS